MATCHKCKNSFVCHDYIEGRIAKPSTICEFCKRISRFLEMLSEATRETGIYLTASRVWEDNFNGVEIGVNVLIDKNKQAESIEYVLTEPIWDNVKLFIDGKEIRE